MPEPGFQINQHVSNLNRFLPFTADFDQLYEEHVDEDSVALPTKALDTAAELVNSGTKLILLTGDAGHGKTHICRRLLERVLGFSAAEAFAAIRTGEDGNTASDGTVDLGQTAAGTQLRIIRDLSELSEVSAAQTLVDALLASGQTTVCCANEGRLRVVLELDDRLLDVRRSLDTALDSGRVSFDGLAVLDLNNQAVAALPEGLVDRLLRDWISDGRRWRICGHCAAADRCPIFARSMLADDEIGPRRRRAFASLFRLVELGGSTITIRELLATTALAITGGFQCRDIHDRVVRRKHDRWQANHLYFEAVFGGAVAPSQRERLRVLRPLMLIDPGAVAARHVDDQLVATADESPPAFSPVDDAAMSGRSHSGRDAQRAAEDHRRLVEFLRRRSFFDDEHGPSVAERAGLRYEKDFDSIVKTSASTTFETDVRDRLLRGLEAVQGIRREGQDGSFYVIDPAFGTTGSARVIAADLEATDVRVLSLSAWWHETSEVAGEVCTLLDWLERRVVLVILMPDGETVPLVLDLLQFEFLMRCADGLADIGFFEATVRRLRANLAHVAERTSTQSASRIQLVVGGDVRRLSIDVDNRIRAARVT